MENLSKGVRFTRVRIVLDKDEDDVVYKTADFHKPWTIGVTPDPAIQARIAALNAELQPILGTVIGTSTVEILRSDVCGRVDGRLCESLVGNVTTDAMRAKYASIGVEFAITNSGGLRDALTCPPAGGGSGLCPAFTPPPYQITRGQVLAVLPFGNIVVTLAVNGAELKTMLENGVSLMPAAQGRFPQVSGLCFTYNVEAAAGSRVTGAVRQAPDGTCTGTPIDLTAGGGPVPDRRERLHGERRRRLPELLQPCRFAGHHGPGARRPHRRGVTSGNQPEHSGPHQVRRPEPRRREQLPDRIALTSDKRAGLRAGPLLLALALVALAGAPVAGAHTPATAIGGAVLAFDSVSVSYEPGAAVSDVEAGNFPTIVGSIRRWRLCPPRRRASWRAAETRSPKRSRGRQGSRHPRRPRRREARCLERRIGDDRLVELVRDARPSTRGIPPRRSRRSSGAFRTSPQAARRGD